LEAVFYFSGSVTEIVCVNVIGMASEISTETLSEVVSETLLTFYFSGSVSRIACVIVSEMASEIGTEMARREMMIETFYFAESVT